MTRRSVTQKGRPLPDAPRSFGARLASEAEADPARDMAARQVDAVILAVVAVVRLKHQIDVLVDVDVDAQRALHAALAVRRVAERAVLAEADPRIAGLGVDQHLGRDDDA